MPAPFPGMDPYLEGVLWTTLHHNLGTEIVRQLASRLRPRYVALPVERFVMELFSAVSVTTANIFPEVAVMEVPAHAGSAEGGVRTAAPLRLATVVPAVPHVSIEIRDTRERRLVTAIEILSPTNKRGDGRREYLAKRQRLLLGETHLMGIDLLHMGECVPMQQPLPDVAYCVLLSRAAERPFMDVWPIPLAMALPTVPVPLLPADADVPLDLQTAFTAAYDLVGYDLLIDYTQPPEVSLPSGEMAWLEQHLQAVGVRP